MKDNFNFERSLVWVLRARLISYIVYYLSVFIKGFWKWFIHFVYLLVCDISMYSSMYCFLTFLFYFHVYLCFFFESGGWVGGEAEISSHRRTIFTRTSP